MAPPKQTITENLGPNLDSQWGGDKGMLLSKARLKSTGKHRNVRAAPAATKHWSFGSVVLVLRVLVEVLRSRRADGQPAGKGVRNVRISTELVGAYVEYAYCGIAYAIGGCAYRPTFIVRKVRRESGGRRGTRMRRIQSVCRNKFRFPSFAIQQK